jgi:hypothetical protein
MFVDGLLINFLYRNRWEKSKPKDAALKILSFSWHKNVLYDFLRNVTIFLLLSKKTHYGKEHEDVGYWYALKYILHAGFFSISC